MTDDQQTIERLRSRPALACGRTEREAATSFAKATWPDLSITVTTVETSSADDPRFRVRVRVGGAMVWTSVKIDGVAVPGGYVVTEWV